MDFFLIVWGQKLKLEDFSQRCAYLTSLKKQKRLEKWHQGSYLATAGWTAWRYLDGAYALQPAKLPTSPYYSCLPVLLYYIPDSCRHHGTKYNSVLPCQRDFCQHSRISGRIEILSKTPKDLKRKSPGTAGPWGCCYWTEAGNALDAHQCCPPGCRMWRG